MSRPSQTESFVGVRRALIGPRLDAAVVAVVVVDVDVVRSFSILTRV